MIVNFKKVTENIPGGKKKGNPLTTTTKVQVDILLNIIASVDDADKDVIPKPCPEGQVCKP